MWYYITVKTTSQTKISDTSLSVIVSFVCTPVKVCAVIKDQTQG